MPERMTEERLAEIRSESRNAVRLVRECLSEIDFLRAELAEARLAAAVADGTATPEMLREAGLLDGWRFDYKRQVWEFWQGVNLVARAGREGWITDGGDESEFYATMIANLRAADAAVRKLLAEGAAG